MRDSHTQLPGQWFFEYLDFYISMNYVQVQTYYTSNSMQALFAGNYLFHYRLQVKTERVCVVHLDNFLYSTKHNLQIDSYVLSYWKALAKNHDQQLSHRHFPSYYDSNQQLHPLPYLIAPLSWLQLKKNCYDVVHDREKQDCLKPRSKIWWNYLPELSE